MGLKITCVHMCVCVCICVCVCVCVGKWVCVRVGAHTNTEPCGHDIGTTQ